MLLTKWTPELFQTALDALTPYNRDLVSFALDYIHYIEFAKVPANVRTINARINKRWPTLRRFDTLDDYSMAVENAFVAMRLRFEEMGITAADDLEFERPVRKGPGK